MQGERVSCAEADGSLEGSTTWTISLILKGIQKADLHAKVDKDGLRYLGYNGHRLPSF